MHDTIFSLTDNIEREGLDSYFNDSILNDVVLNSRGADYIGDDYTGEAFWEQVIGFKNYLKSISPDFKVGIEQNSNGDNIPYFMFSDKFKQALNKHWADKVREIAKGDDKHIIEDVTYLFDDDLVVYVWEHAEPLHRFVNCADPRVKYYLVSAVDYHS